MSYWDNPGPVIDTMFGLPDKKGFQGAYHAMKAGYRDRESRTFDFPAQYMFKDVPDVANIADPVGFTIEQMDKYNIERAFLALNTFSDLNAEAQKRFPDRFVFDLPIDWRLSRGFRRVVLQSLHAEVPYGHVVSYRELAERVGHPGASRAVGTAMATNPVPIVVPCHRVLRTGGALGGYGGGLDMKRALLALEGATLV